MKSKKGMELSINFLVVVILSIVMLGLGLALVRTFFATSEELSKDIDDTTRARINELLSFGQVTALPFNAKNLKPEQGTVFALGVLNVEPNPIKLRVQVDSIGGFDPQNQKIAEDLTSWVKYDPNPFTLDPHEQKDNPIFIRPSKTALKGTYIFNTCFCKENECTKDCRSSANIYGTIQKIRVTVT